MPNGVATSVHIERGLSAFDAGATWVRQRSLATFTLSLTVLLVIRSGLYFMPVTNLEAPGGLASTSWASAASNAWLVLLKLGQVDSRLAFEILSLLVLALSISAIAWLIHRYETSIERWLLGVVLLGSLGTVLTGYGRADTFLVVGAVMFVVAGIRSPSYLVFGSLLIVAGNRMQSVLMAVALLALAMVPEFRRWLRPALVLLGIGVMGVVVDSLLAEEAGRTTQLGWFGQYLGTSLENSLQNAPLLMYALFGVGWIPVIGALFMLGRSRALVVSLALVAIPAAAMFTTLDGMRVGVGVSAVPFLVVVAWVGREATEAMSPIAQSRFLFLFLMIAIVTPAMHVSTGDVTQPWSYLWFSVNFWSDVAVR